MNVLSRIAVLSLSAAGLAACATTDDQAARVSPQSNTIGLDGQYMGAVEQIARRRGIEVMWVNPPTTQQALVAQRDPR